MGGGGGGYRPSTIWAVDHEYRARGRSLARGCALGESRPLVPDAPLPLQVPPAALSLIVVGSLLGTIDLQLGVLIASRFILGLGIGGAYPLPRAVPPPPPPEGCALTGLGRAEDGAGEVAEAGVSCTQLVPLLRLPLSRPPFCRPLGGPRGGGGGRGGALLPHMEGRASGRGHKPIGAAVLVRPPPDRTPTLT